jgi:hypothetical protein
MLVAVKELKNINVSENEIQQFIAEAKVIIVSYLSLIYCRS